MILCYIESKTFVNLLETWSINDFVGTRVKYDTKEGTNETFTWTDVREQNKE